MTEHKKKMIAPIVVTVLLVLYFAGYGAIIIFAQPPWFALILGCLIPFGLAGVLVAMLLERIKEIRSGEEDDLSQY